MKVVVFIISFDMTKHQYYQMREIDSLRTQFALISSRFFLVHAYQMAHAVEVHASGRRRVRGDRIQPVAEWALLGWVGAVVLARGVAN
jgi:hypothetical protein